MLATWVSTLYRLRLAKQQLCTCIMLFCTFLCRRCTTWKCIISRPVDDLNTKQALSFPFLNFDTVPLNLTQEIFVNTWRTEQDGISAIKFEATQINFLGDLFVAVRVVVAKALCLHSAVARWYWFIRAMYDSSKRATRRFNSKKSPSRPKRSIDILTKFSEFLT